MATLSKTQCVRLGPAWSSCHGIKGYWLSKSHRRVTPTWGQEGVTYEWEFAHTEKEEMTGAGRMLGFKQEMSALVVVETWGSGTQPEEAGPRDVLGALYSLVLFLDPSVSLRTTMMVRAGLHDFFHHALITGQGKVTVNSHMELWAKAKLPPPPPPTPCVLLSQISVQHRLSNCSRGLQGRLPPPQSHKQPHGQRLA